MKLRPSCHLSVLDFLLKLAADIKGKHEKYSFNRVEGEGVIGRGTGDSHRTAENASTWSSRIDSQPQANEKSRARTKKGNAGACGTSTERHEVTPDDDDGAARDSYYETRIIPVLDEMTALAQSMIVPNLNFICTGN